MLVEPLLPVEVPVGWMILQKDQHRRSLSLTPGLTDIQPCNSWLSQLVKTVQLLVRVMFRIRREIVVPSLSIVNWIREKTGIAPPLGNRFSFLPPLAWHRGFY